MLPSPFDESRPRFIASPSRFHEAVSRASPTRHPPSLQIDADEDRLLERGGAAWTGTTHSTRSRAAWGGASTAAVCSRSVWPASAPAPSPRRLHDLLRRRGGANAGIARR